MNASWESRDHDYPLSIAIALTALFAFAAVLASLTILGQVSQLLKLSFRTYSYAAAVIAVIVLATVLACSIKNITRSVPKDYGNLLILLVLAVVGAFLAVSLHRVGRISPDEYYNGANAVFLIQHPATSMGFESRLFYSRDPVESIAFLTAGAYEYAEAALAFILESEFAKIYYVVGAGVTGFLIPLSLFLLIYCFSGSAGGSILGVLATMTALTLMGETSWAPGANSFLRAFEGKALLQFVGAPALAAFSIFYFASPRPVSWLRLIALSTAMAGASTTAFAMLPILGVVIWASYVLSSGMKLPADRQRRLVTAAYGLSFTYLLLWGVFVAAHDGASPAAFFNSAYPDTFSGYASGFVYAPFPLTAILVIVTPLLALMFTRGTSRRFLFWWIVLAIVLVLNPIAAAFWLKYLRGVYLRMLYILPFPGSIGILIACTYDRTHGLRRSLRMTLVGAVCAALAILPFTTSVSIFRLDLYAPGNVLADGDLTRAVDVIAATPAGVMLAPWPLSGAISMLDSLRPQVLTRSDIMHFYLAMQGRAQDADRRDIVQTMLDAGNRNPAALTRLLDEYPEIVSIVMDRQSYSLNGDILRPALAERGFTRQNDFIPGTVIFVR